MRAVGYERRAWQSSLKRRDLEIWETNADTKTVGAKTIGQGWPQQR